MARYVDVALYFIKDLDNQIGMPWNLCVNVKITTFYDYPTSNINLIVRK